MPSLCFNSPISSGRDRAPSGRWLSWLIAVLALGMLYGTGHRPVAAWQTESAAQPSATGPAIESVTIGFDGQVLLGRWVPISISIGQWPESTDELDVEVEVLDGDAVPVSYRWTAGAGTPDDDGVSRISGLIRIGRRGPANISLTDRGGNLLARRQFDLDELGEHHSFLPATTRLSLVIGLQDRAAADQLPVDRGATAVNAIAGENQVYPLQWIGYESLDRLVVVTQNQDGLPMQGPEIEALAQWIRYGGFAIFSCGSNSPQWFRESSSLVSLGCVPFVRTFQTRRSGPLELLVGSNDQLVQEGGPPLTMAEFQPGDATVESSVDDRPALMQRRFGMGAVSILAVDFTEPPLAGWSGTRNLLAQALSIEQVADADTSPGGKGRVTHNGYEDLSGQLRAAQDQFSDVSFITFTMVALLVTLFILLIGPADYFFLKLVVGRMEWTWITFTCLSLAFCGLAIALVAWTKSPGFEINQVEIVDVDAHTGQVRGTLWTNIYSPRTVTYDVQMGTHNQLAGDIDQRWLSWQGLPGTGLGGMQTQSDFGLYRRNYVCQQTESASHVESLPAQNASTRMLVGRWNGQLASAANSNLRQSPSTDAALGTVTNPFDVPLMDCVLLYGDWAYLLERPLNPGETIVVEDDMREKTIRGYYTRRRRQDSDEVNVPWNPADMNVPRILNMMMFFEVIGGQAYATLSNDYQRWLDMSRSLRMGQAILTGRIRQATTDMQLNGQSIDDYDRQTTVVRVLFPVQPREPRRNRNSN